MRQLSYPFRRAIGRLKSAGKTRFFLDLLNVLATIIVMYVALRLSLAKPLGINPHPLSSPTSATGSAQPLNVSDPVVLTFAFASLYLVIHKYLLRERPGSKRWIRQDRSRKQTISHAINLITKCLYQEKFSPVDLALTEQYILRAMCSLVETTVEDIAGIYINVNLLIPDPTRDESLMVLSRAKPERGLYVRYPKQGYLAWEAIQHPEKYVYEPSFEVEGKPYKCILMFPIADQLSTGTIQGIGAVSIDSERKDHFGPYVEELAIALLPHLANLRMILLLRRRNNVWPD